MSKEYQEYLRSEHWQETRKKRIIVDNGKCAICGSPNGLQVHHISYDRKGEENVDYDLITLCRSCHEAVHAVINEKMPEVSEIKKEYQEKARQAVKPCGEEWAVKAAGIIACAVEELLGGKRPQKYPTIVRMVKDMLDLSTSGCGAIYFSTRHAPYNIATHILSKNKCPEVTAIDVLNEINKVEPASGAMLKFGGTLSVNSSGVYFSAKEPLAGVWIEKAWKRLDEITQEKFNLPFYREESNGEEKQGI